MTSTIREALSSQLAWRYATKQFDPTRRISDADWSVLEQSLILAPSSYGLQPWKFAVVTDPALKATLPDASWGQSQPKDCSHFVVIAARQQTDDGFVQKLIESIAHTRNVPVESLEGLKSAILSKSRRNPAEHLIWNSKQCYIALGFLLHSAALLGIDACPMEGIVPPKMDELLSLTGSGYTSVVACALGYRAADDKYATAPKVRYASEDVILRR
jgi:nitroreductase